MNNESEASSYELQFSIDPSGVIVDQIFIWYLEELKLSNSCFDISIIKILKFFLSNSLNWNRWWISETYSIVRTNLQRSLTFLQRLAPSTVAKSAVQSSSRTRHDRGATNWQDPWTKSESICARGTWNRDEEWKTSILGHLGWIAMSKEGEGARASGCLSRGNILSLFLFSSFPERKTVMSPSIFRSKMENKIEKEKRRGQAGW